MPDEVTVDVEVEVEVDRDELEIERGDAEVIEASYEANGVEIEVEAVVETRGAGGDANGEAGGDDGPDAADASDAESIE